MKILPVVAALAAGSLGGAHASAQDWAKAMFNATSHDFGVVARGAKVEHPFIVENVYEEDAHIASVSSSCGCSTPRLNRNTLKTWEKAEVLVSIDTRGFLGRKDATITVVFDKPFPAEVQLQVHSYIRSDIVVQPGEVQFGSVPVGKEARKDLAVNYAGRDDWRIERVEATNPNIVAAAQETGRSPGLVNYALTVHLKPGAPPGYIRDQLVLVTNDYDPKAARVPVAVEGLVISPLSARPSPLMLGTVEVGHTVTRNLVLQGQTPFRVVAADFSDARFRCGLPNEAKTVHILPITFENSGPSTTGTVRSKLHIVTDLSGTNTVDVDVSATLSAAAH